MKKVYEENINNILQGLVSMRKDLFAKALNLAMAGELKDINQVFGVGEVYSFSLDHLDKSEDANLQLVVDLIKAVQGTAESIANLNALNIDEFIKV